MSWTARSEIRMGKKPQEKLCWLHKIPFIRSWSVRLCCLIWDTRFYLSLNQGNSKSTRCNAQRRILKTQTCGQRKDISMCCMVLQSIEGSPKDHTWVLGMCSYKNTDCQTAAQPCQVCALEQCISHHPKHSPLPSLTLLCWKKILCTFKWQRVQKTNLPKN